MYQVVINFLVLSILVYEINILRDIMNISPYAWHNF